VKVGSFAKSEPEAEAEAEAEELKVV